MKTSRKLLLSGIFFAVIAFSIQLRTLAAVTVSEKDLVIPTYLAGDPEPNPMFYFGRGSQGAQGRVYPYPLYDTLTNVNRYRTKSNNLMAYVSQYGARVSPLLWIMFNSQLNSKTGTDFRPLSYDHSAIWTKDQYIRIDPFLPQNRDLLTLIEWADMGAQYSNNVAH